MSKNAVVTGAGSGVGQAVALALIKEGWHVAIVGRRTETLQDTVNLAGARQGRCCFPCPCDIGHSEAVEKLGRDVLAKFGSVQVLVNAAGTNAPEARARSPLARGLSRDDGYEPQRRLLHHASFSPRDARREEQAPSFTSFPMPANKLPPKPAPRM